ncbi:MAG: sodium/solute symporter [Spirochaetaceae bacterium]|jgi:SSS family solute:Na+ symporter|nr:sodium/solute symporter [Spirochaetaceae bacterium]
MTFNIVLLAVFFALLTGIGIWGMRRTKTLGDFFLGGRKMGPWVSAFAYGTSYFSAVIFIGFAGTQGWQLGLNSLWIAAGNAVIGSMLAWLVLAKRTRRQTQNLDAMTMPGYLQERYGAKHLKPIAAVIVFLFLLPYSASIFKGLGHLFEAVFHIPYDLALILMIAFTGVYLILGGYFAVVVIDFIQGIFMIVGAFAVVCVFVSEGGGLFSFLAGAAAGYNEHIPPEARPGILSIVSVVFMTSFGTWGLPQMTQKFYAIKNEKVIPKAVIATTLFAAIIGFSAYMVGSSAHIFFTPDSVPRGPDGRVLYDLIVPALLTEHLPEMLMSLILLFVLSASMSTLSSLVMISSSAIAIDLYPVKNDPNTGKERATAMMRFLSLLFIIVSYFISRFQISIIVYLMSLSWGAVSGAFAAPYIYGLYWKRATKTGAYAGLLGGLVIEIILFFVLGPSRSPLTASIAILAPFIIVPLVSVFTRPPEDSLLEKAFAPLQGEN